MGQWRTDRSGYMTNEEVKDAMGTTPLIHGVRVMKGDSGWLPWKLIDGEETFWLIEKPSTIRQTRYETADAAIRAAWESVKR